MFVPIKGTNRSTIESDLTCIAYKEIDLAPSLHLKECHAMQGQRSPIEANEKKM